MPNGTGNFRNVQISWKKDNLERWTKIFETNFQKISVSFDFEPKFLEIFTSLFDHKVIFNREPNLLFDN